MLRRRVLELALLVSPLVAGATGIACDNPEEFQPSSRFPIDDEHAREISGRLRRGFDFVEGAVVRVEAHPGYAGDARFVMPSPVVTNAGGFYRFAAAPLRYDLSFRDGREAAFFRGLVFRYLEPAFGEDTTPPSWTAKVVLAVAPPPAPGRSLAFFASGDDVVGVSGDLASGVSVALRRYSTTPSPTTASTTTLHVVELDGSLAAATAYGHADVFLGAGDPVPLTVQLSPVGPRAPVSFDATIPAGATAADAEVVMHFGVRATALVVARAPLGQAIAIARVPSAAYAVRVRATKAGAVSDSGLLGFDPGAGTVKTPLPALPVVVSPADGAVLDGLLVADVAGVREDLLTPLPGDGPTLRVVDVERDTAVPDPTPLGLPRPVGRYTWVVRSFPDLKNVEGLAGPDVRAAFASSTSAPRTIELR